MLILNRPANRTSFGTPHRHYRETDSTNARTRELAGAGAPHGLVVTADAQTAGRGRQGRSWFGRPGRALLYSALLRPMGDRPLLPLMAPLAVCDAAEALAGVSCRLKWPNDVWIDDRKLAGILVEGHAATGDRSWAVIGIGLNVSLEASDFPDELKATATSLAIAAAAQGTDVAADPLTAGAALQPLNEALERWCFAPDDQVLAAFRERDALIGRELSWDDGAGVAAGIDDSGHLLVETEAGTRALGAGEVHLSLG